MKKSTIFIIASVFCILFGFNLIVLGAYSTSSLDNRIPVLGFGICFIMNSFLFAREVYYARGKKDE